MRASVLQREKWCQPRFLARLVEVVTEELAIDILSGGSTTLNRADLVRGLEGDECWWIQHEAEVRGLREIDLSRDPRPDLALEVEISRSALNRMAIYAALRVPEVWRWDGLQVSAFHHE